MQKYLDEYVTEARTRIAAGMSPARAAQILRWSSGLQVSQVGALSLLGR